MQACQRLTWDSFAYSHGAYRFCPANRQGEVFSVVVMVRNALSTVLTIVLAIVLIWLAWWLLTELISIIGSVIVSVIIVILALFVLRGIFRAAP